MVMYNPTSLERGLRAVFLAQLAMDENSWVDMLASVIPSDKNNEKYAWLGEPPQMSQFVDEFKATPISDAGYTLTNLKYGAVLEVLRDDLSDDLTGGIVMRTRQLAAVAARHPNKLIAAGIVANPVGYDGVSFFNATHPIRGQQTATQTNLVTLTGVTTALVSADLQSAVAVLLGQLAENQEPFVDSISKMVLLAPLSFRKAVRESINAMIINNTSNVGFDGDDIIPMFTARLTGSVWYLFNTDGPVRPIILQEREPLEFVAQTNSVSTMDSDATFLREIFRYKTRVRRAVGVSFWQKAVKVA